MDDLSLLGELASPKWLWRAPASRWVFLVGQVCPLMSGFGASASPLAGSDTDAALVSESRRNLVVAILAAQTKPALAAAASK